MAKHAKTVLWVDDDIEDLDAYVKALRDTGLSVVTAASTEEAEARAKECAFDIALVDLKMKRPNGIECLRRLHRELPNAALAALSSFLYRDQYRQELRALGFPVELIDKDFPHVEAVDFAERFLRPILAVAERGVAETISVQETRLDSQQDVNPFDIPLAEFMQKPNIEKEKLTDLAGELSKELLDEAFASGNIWVMLCGDKLQIRLSAEDAVEIPSEDEIMKFARVQRRYPFRFFSATYVEDGWSVCDQHPHRAGYPTVTLDVGGKIRNFHFDTGSPMTFFSWEELVDLGLIRPGLSLARACRKGYKPYWAAELDIVALLKCQRSGETKKVKLTGQAVREWLESPYARFCSPGCNMKDELLYEDEPTLCVDRFGLIGRNILRDNAIALILDGKMGQTALE